MNTRVVLARAATTLAVLLSLLSMLVLPWAWYGDVDIPLHRLPNWETHLGSVAVLYAAVVWTMLTPTGRRLLPLSVTVSATAAAAATAVFVALGYDNASALFTGVVPLARPTPGPGSVVAVAAALLGLGAAAILTTGNRKPETAAKRARQSPQ